MSIGAALGLVLIGIVIGMILTDSSRRDDAGRRDAAPRDGWLGPSSLRSIRANAYGDTGPDRIGNLGVGFERCPECGKGPGDLGVVESILPYPFRIAMPRLCPKCFAPLTRDCHRCNGSGYVTTRLSPGKTHCRRCGRQLRRSEVSERCSECAGTGQVPEPPHQCRTFGNFSF